MVGWSLRHRGAELLAHPVSLQLHVSRGEPAGIPLLHPWANRLASPRYEVAGRRVRLDLSAPNVHTDPGGLPIHGLVIGCPCWDVLEHTTDRVRAGLNYEAWPELMAGFPFPHDGLADPAEFAISGAGRRVSLRFVEGYRFAQVYAPRSSRFICFEPMTAPVNPFESERTRLVEPGSAYIARFEIVVGPSGRE